jgi:hypothetical protein
VRVNITAVRARYDHISRSWRRANPERRAALVGELELLSLQLPQVQDADSHDQGRDEIVALRADIMELITAITIGMSDAD